MSAENVQRRHEPIHGVDFMFNYYSILGIPQTASPEEIKVAFTDKIKQYHPDKYTGLAPELAQQASIRTKLLLDAQKVLTVPEEKTKYDTSLSEWEGPISEEGYAIQSVFAGSDTIQSIFAGSYASLTTGAGENDTVLESMLKQASALSGFNEAIFNAMKEAYLSSDSPSELVKEAYRAALKTKDSHLALQDSFRRGYLGLDGHSIVSTNIPSEYALHAKNAIHRGRDVFSEYLDETLPSLDTGNLLMINSGITPEQEKEIDRESALAIARNFAIENFDRIAQEVEEIALQREEVIQERLQLAETKYIANSTKENGTLLLKIDVATESVFLSFKLENLEVTGESVSPELQELYKSPSQELIAEMEENGVSMISVVHEESIPFETLIEAIVTSHFTKPPNQTTDA